MRFKRAFYGAPSIAVSVVCIECIGYGHVTHYQIKRNFIAQKNGFMSISCVEAAIRKYIQTQISFDLFTGRGCGCTHVTLSG